VPAHLQLGECRQAPFGVKPGLRERARQLVSVGERLKQRYEALIPRPIEARRP
jgi:hypothetical protein